MQHEYISYTSHQFAADDDFIAWVRNGVRDDAWTNWIAQHPETGKTIEEAKRIVRHLDGIHFTSLSEEQKALLWNQIRTKAQPTTDTRKPRLVRLWRLAGAAAVAAIALFIWMQLPGETHTIAVEERGRRMHQLPEGSTVTINAASTLTFDGKHFKQDRTIHLEGESFFNVTPGSTFTVTSALGSVEVLGTSFNVIARDDRFEVTCFTGKVRVTTTGGESKDLTPGMHCVLKDQQLQVETRSLPDQPEWTEGKFRYSDQPLRVVLEDLERQYGITVVATDEIKSLRYTGIFEQGDLTEAIRLITWPLHLQSTVNGDTVQITR